MKVPKRFTTDHFLHCLHGPCVLCGLAAPLDEGICGNCLDTLPVLSGPLCRCGLPLPAATEMTEPCPPCGRCLHRPPPFRMVAAPRPWSFPLDRLLRRYKYRGAMMFERPLVRIWDAGLAAMDPPEPQALVPVPLHWRRQWYRGFNQAARLARGLSTCRGLPCLSALERAHATPHQQGLRAASRRRSLRRAFRTRMEVEGLHLALIDDVVTTASTAREAARELLEAGAARVDIWALARVLPGPDN